MSFYAGEDRRRLNLDVHPDALPDALGYDAEVHEQLEALAHPITLFRCDIRASCTQIAPIRTRPRLLRTSVVGLGFATTRFRETTA